MLFDVAPADAHAVAAVAFRAAGAHVPRACLLRRVVADFAAQPSFQGPLAAGGLRGDRLSVWALQVDICPKLVNMSASLCAEGHWQDALQEACSACMCPVPASCGQHHGQDQLLDTPAVGGVCTGRPSSRLYTAMQQASLHLISPVLIARWYIEQPEGLQEANLAEQVGNAAF